MEVQFSLTPCWATGSVLAKAWPTLQKSDKTNQTLREHVSELKSTDPGSCYEAKNSSVEVATQTAWALRLFTITEFPSLVPRQEQLRCYC